MLETGLELKQSPKVQYNMSSKFQFKAPKVVNNEKIHLNVKPNLDVP